MKTKYTKRKDGRIQFSTTYKGHRKFFYGKSDRDIDRAVDAWKAEVDGGSYGIRTFKQVADEWWEDKLKDISITTEPGYRVYHERAIEAFGNFKVNEITPQMIYQWLNKFKAMQYSSKTINNTKAVVKGIFDVAFIAGEIQSNPVVAIPNIKGIAKVPRKPATDDDIVKIEQFKTESLMARMYYFMLYTGARRGEAAALQMKDIDIQNKKARVYKTLAYGRYSTATVKMSPKTEAGIRDLVLLDNVIDVLPYYDNPDTYIFYPDGFPTRKLFETAFEKFRKEHEISATAHQLRHSYASMLHSAGVDVKDAQAFLGHSNISVTQDVYTHLEDHHRTDVLNNLNKYVKTIDVKIDVKSPQTLDFT